MIVAMTIAMLAGFSPCCEAAGNPPPLVAGKWIGTYDSPSQKFEITLHPQGTLSAPQLINEYIATFDGYLKSQFLQKETLATGSSSGVFFNISYSSPESIPYRYADGRLIVEKALLTTRIEEKGSPRLSASRKQTDFYLSMEATVSVTSTGLTLTGTWNLSNSGSNEPPRNKPWQVSIDNLTAQDWLNAGNDAAIAGNLELALSSYQNALKLKPDWDAPMANIAQVYAAQGNYNAALQQVNQAMDKAATNKKYHQMLWNRSFIYESMGNQEQANKDRAQARTAGITGDPANGVWD